MAKPKNPPAFPRTSTSFASSQDGMTLRDWFAGQALAGFATRDADMNVPALDTARRWAKAAYFLADAMLSARQTTDREDGK